jgi:hypothetical protein
MYPTQQSEHVSYITRFVMVPKVRSVASIRRAATERPSQTYGLAVVCIMSTTPSEPTGRPVPD